MNNSDSLKFKYLKIQIGEGNRKTEQVDRHGNLDNVNKTEKAHAIYIKLKTNI